MKEILLRLSRGESLPELDAFEAMRLFLSDDTGDAARGAFLAFFAQRIPTAHELYGFSEALLERSVIPEVDTSVCLDLCGTGGDGKNTFNISTAAAFTVAACGVKVLKHGAGASSSAYGSSDLVTALGVPLPRNSAEITSQLRAAGISFLHAPTWHPDLKKIAPIRRLLRFRTLFNALGPLINPTRPKIAVYGVWCATLQPAYADCLTRQKTNFVVVHSTDGFDEVALTTDAVLLSSRGRECVTHETFGVECVMADELVGSESSRADQFRTIIGGEGTPAQSAVVAANAAIALRHARPEMSLRAAFSRALEAIQDGGVLQVLRALIKPAVTTDSPNKLRNEHVAK